MDQQAAKKTPAAASGAANIRIVVADDHPVVRFGVRTCSRTSPALMSLAKPKTATTPSRRPSNSNPTSSSSTWPCAPPRPRSHARHHDQVAARQDRAPHQHHLRAADHRSAFRSAPAASSSKTPSPATSRTLCAPSSAAITGSAASASPTSSRPCRNSRPRRPPSRTQDLRPYPRELEVVTCIVEGCSNRDIAKQFNISEETVKRHLSNVFDKTGVSTRLELALFAIAHKLVEL